MGSRAPSRSELMDRLLGRFVAFAEARDDIRGALVIGSRARRDAPADEHSDLDLPFFCTEPARYIEDAAWLGELGDPILAFVEPTADGKNTELRALFEPDLDVDFVPLPASLLDELESMDPRVAARRIAGEPGFTRGHLVVLDKDGALRKLDALPKNRGPPRAPSQREYEAAADEFLYRALWTARKLRRGELWVAKMSVDSDMKALLLRMIEWHAATKGCADTWHGGRFLERWAGPDVVSRLGDTFASYDNADVERALLASLDQFCGLALEVASRTGRKYPSERAGEVRRLVEGVLSSGRGKVK